MARAKELGAEGVIDSAAATLPINCAIWMRSLTRQVAPRKTFPCHEFPLAEVRDVHERGEARTLVGARCCAFLVKMDILYKKTVLKLFYACLSESLLC